MVAVPDQQSRVAAELSRLHSDDDVLDLIDRFFVWRKSNQASDGNSLDNMLAFMRDHLEQRKAVATALMPQLMAVLDEMAVLSRSLDSDLNYAATYVVDALKNAPEKVDYDERFFYLGHFLGNAKIIAPGKPDYAKFMGHYSGYFKNAVAVKIMLMYRQLNTPQKLTQQDRDLARTPILMLLLKRYYNLALHIDNMQMGTNAWGKGADMVSALHEYISSPTSYGQLCSLRRADLPEKVSWQHNAWIQAPENWHWLNEGIADIKTIPSKYKTA